MKSESFRNPFRLILVLEVQVSRRLVWRRIVATLAFVGVVFALLLLFLLHPVAVGAANVAKVFVILDVLVEVGNVHLLVFPGAVDVGKVSPLDEELVGAVPQSLLRDDVVDLKPLGTDAVPEMDKRTFRAGLFSL